MRIAYFSDNFFPEISGISDSVITTGEELRRRGHEVVYVAPRYAPRDYAPVTPTDVRHQLPVRRLPSIPFFNSPTGHSRIALPLGTSIPFLRRFKPDVIHVQSPYGCGLEALLASRVLGIPLVGTNHTPLEEFIHYAPGGRLYEPLALKYEVWFYNRSTFITAPYQGLIDEMRTRGLQVPWRGQANPIPFEPAYLTPAEKHICKTNLKVSGPLILSSGRLAPEKHVDVVIRAFAKVLQKLPTATLMITGHGSAEVALKKLVHELSLTKYVRFVGYVSASQLAEIYCVTDVYTVMSTAETQSLSLMQGFANGVPAVSARSRGLIEYTPTDCGFTVAPGDVDALAEKLLAILTDPLVRTRLGVAAVEYVKRFTTTAVALAWEAIFKEAINRGVSHASQIVHTKGAAASR